MSSVNAHMPGIGPEKTPLPPRPQKEAAPVRRPRPLEEPSAKAAPPPEETHAPVDPVDELDDQEEDDHPWRSALIWFFNPSWIISALFHMILILTLALLTMSSPDMGHPTAELLALSESTDELIEEFDEVTLDVEVDPTEFEQTSEVAELAESLEVLTAHTISTPELTAPEVDMSLEPALPMGLTATELGAELDPLGDIGPPNKFYGSTVRGNAAVVFDVTASMYGSIPAVCQEINARFANAQVVAVHGATFKRYGTSLQLVPYRDNTAVHKYMHDNTKRNPRNLPSLARTHEELLSLRHCDSLPPEGLLQSLGTALEALLRQPGRRPKTIFVFSDFADGVDRAYMQEVQQLAIRQNVKIVVYHPVKFTRDRAVYEAFAMGTGGELRESLER